MLLLFAGLLIPLGAAQAQEGGANNPNAGQISPTQDAAQIEGVSAELVVEEGEYFVGDLIPLTLQVSHPAGYRLIPIQLDGNWGEVEVRQVYAPEVSANPDGSETTTQIIEVSLWAPGAYNTAELPVSVADTSGAVGQVSAAPVALNIGSVLIEGDTNLRDLKPQAQLPLPPVWPWAVAGLLLVALVTLGVLWMIRRRRLNRLAEIEKQPDTRKPHEVALDELERIEGLNLPEQGRYKEHYTLASDVLRQYLESAYHVPTLDRTTGEIRRALKYTPLDTEIKSNLVEMLNEADLVKFAKVRPEMHLAKAYVPQVRNSVAYTIPPEPIHSNGNGHKPGEIHSNETHTPKMEVNA
jgi:hypothetical protein